jgi:hypothetical protein
MNLRTISLSFAFVGLVMSSCSTEVETDPRSPYISRAEAIQSARAEWNLDARYISAKLEPSKFSDIMLWVVTMHDVYYFPLPSGGPAPPPGYAKPVFRHSGDFTISVNASNGKTLNAGGSAHAVEKLSPEPTCYVAKYVTPRSLLWLSDSLPLPNRIAADRPCTSADFDLYPSDHEGGSMQETVR